MHEEIQAALQLKANAEEEKKKLKEKFLSDLKTTEKAGTVIIGVFHKNGIYPDYIAQQFKKIDENVSAAEARLYNQMEKEIKVLKSDGRDYKKGSEFHKNFTKDFFVKGSDFLQRTIDNIDYLCSWAVNYLREQTENIKAQAKAAAEQARHAEQMAKYMEQNAKEAEDIRRRMDDEGFGRNRRI